jgi:hypothetical protein
MAISRILSGQFLSRDDHLSHPSRNRGAKARSRSRGTVMRRYPRIIGPAALPLFCLAPHGVFHASRIASRAVSSYLAFSPLPALCCQRTGGVFSVTLSVTAVFQLWCPRVLRGMPPYGVRTFLQQAKKAHQRSSAIGKYLITASQEEKRAADYTDTGDVKVKTGLALS